MFRRPPGSRLFPYATLFRSAPGKTDANVLWAGSDDGLIHVTRDGGKNWTNVTPKDMPEFGRASIIDASSDRKSTRLNSSHGYIPDASFCLKKETTAITELVK